MRVDVADLTGASGKRGFVFVVPAAEMMDFFQDPVLEGEVRVEGDVFFTGEVYRAEGTIIVTKCFDCDRCLAYTRREERYEFAEDFSREPREDALPLSEAGDIDIAEVVRETIVAAQPTANYCREDCKGLCPVCGKNLNEGDCACEKESIDLRLAALSALLDSDEAPT